MLRQANSSFRAFPGAAGCLCALLLLSPFFALAAAAQAREDGLDASLAYLDSAIERYNAGDTEGARRFVDAGMLYSVIPADLFYLKAVLLSGAGSPRADVLEAAYAAFDEDRRWFRFDAGPPAAFAAALLADTARFQEALALLDRFDSEVSADTAFIRCKIAYLQGAVGQARNAVNSALRLWPSDTRFPLLFFQFEGFHRLDAVAENAASFVRPANISGMERVLEIAAWIVRAWNIPGDPDSPLELSLASVPYLRQASPLDAARVVRRIWSMGGFSSLSPQAASFLAVEALRENAAPASEALAAFFSLAETSEGIPLAALEYLCAIAASSSGQDLREQIAVRLSGFNGMLSADSNGDFVPDSRVSYRLGRPHSAVYDLNQDGYPDMTVECGFGEPVSIYFPGLNCAIEYQAYPYATSVRLANAVFVLRSASFSCAPLVARNLRSSFLSPDFFFLYADPSFTLPNEAQLATGSVIKIETAAVASASGAEATLRRETFYDENGQPVSGREIINGAVVSRMVFRGGQVSECDRDDDGDGYFEKKIVYGRDGETLLVDTDGDMAFNYMEFTGVDGSVRQSWLEPGSSTPAVQWVKMPDGTASAVWLHPESGQAVTARFSASAFPGDADLPGGQEGSFSVSYLGEERGAFRDAGTGIWWLDALPNRFSPPASADVAGTASRLKLSGLPVVFADAGFAGGFVRVLKIGGYLFAETVYGE